MENGYEFVNDFNGYFVYYYALAFYGNLEFKYRWIEEQASFRHFFSLIYANSRLLYIQTYPRIIFEDMNRNFEAKFEATLLSNLPLPTNHFEGMNHIFEAKFEGMLLSNLPSTQLDAINRAYLASKIRASKVPSEVSEAKFEVNNHECSLD